jgi:hypothetical protein
VFLDVPISEERHGTVHKFEIAINAEIDSEKLLFTMSIFAFKVVFSDSVSVIDLLGKFRKFKKVFGVND